MYSLGHGMLSGADLTVLGLGVVWIGVGCLVSAVRTGGTAAPQSLLLGLSRTKIATSKVGAVP